MSVSVAGLAPIPLTRTSGPAHNGTWQSAPVQLPAGSWTATFTAQTQGEDDPAPVTVGPINVTAPTPTPAPDEERQTVELVSSIDSGVGGEPQAEPRNRVIQAKGKTTAVLRGASTADPDAN